MLNCFLSLLCLLPWMTGLAPQCLRMSPCRGVGGSFRGPECVLWYSCFLSLGVMPSPSALVGVPIVSAPAAVSLSGAFIPPASWSGPLITSFPSVQSTSVSLSTSGPLVPPLPTGVTSAVSAPMSGNFLCPAPPWGVSGLLVGVRNLHSRLPVLSSVVYVGEGLLPIPSNLLNVSSGGSSSTWACSCRSLGPPSGGGGEA